MIYAVVILGVICVAQLGLLYVTANNGVEEREKLFSEATYERTALTDRLMAVMSDEPNPLAASAQITGIRALSSLDRPVADTEVNYVDDKREYELQRSGNGNNEEAQHESA